MNGFSSISRRSFSIASRTGRGCDAMKKDAKWAQSREASNWSRTQAQSPGAAGRDRALAAASERATEGASAPPVTDKARGQEEPAAVDGHRHGASRKAGS